MKYDLIYSRFGPCSILIEWPPKIDESILEDILLFKNRIENYHVNSKLEIINTYNSILISYDTSIENINDKITVLKQLYLESFNAQPRKRQVWEIPVCYDTELGIDLEDFAIQKSLSISEVVSRHSQQIYTVYFIGFLPGFLYLGGLHKSLYFDRKAIPNLNIKKGAVGIGGNQTGIYPQDSPGGWHIIGSSPIDFFNSDSQTPCFAKSGDKIKFKPISREVYNHILETKASSTYNLNTYVLE